MAQTLTTPPCPVRSRPRRWFLAGVGVVCVGLGALGVFLPGLPTTIFLIAASWCFARSCPWLEERLVRVPLFRPFLGYLDTGKQMPRRTVIVTLVVMWLAIAVSASAVSLGERPQPVVAAVIIGLGLVGTYFVLRLARHRIAESAAATRPAETPAP